MHGAAIKVIYIEYSLNYVTFVIIQHKLTKTFAISEYIEVLGYPEHGSPGSHVTIG